METLDLIIDILFLPLCIFVVLMVHEYGHYLAARVFKISIENFSIGYGRKLWQKTDKHGVVWKLKLLPVMGHVRLSEKNAKPDTVLFNEAPFWPRMMTVIAGPAINIIFAFAITFLFLAVAGLPSRTNELSGVEPGAPAALAGLKTGDVILEVEGEKLRRFYDLWLYTSEMPGVDLHIKVKRGDEIFETTVTPEEVEYRDPDTIKRSHGRIGVMIGYSLKDLATLKSINGTEIIVPPTKEGDDRSKAERERDAAREAIIPYLGQHVSLGLESVDDETHTYETFLDTGLNEHLFDEDDDKYGAFVSGRVEDNFYLKLGLAESMREAGRQTGRFIVNLAKVPFQVFPIDSQLVKPWVVVTGDDDFISRKLYEFVHRFALVSVFIALINLVPFPGLDGNIILQIAVQRFTGEKDPSRSKAYKYALLTVLSLLYLSIIMCNVGDIPRYLADKAEDISENRS